MYVKMIFNGFEIICWVWNLVAGVLWARPGQEHHAWGARELCPGAQTTADQAGLQPEASGPRDGPHVRLRLPPNDHPEVRDAQHEFWELVQAQRPNPEVAGDGRSRDGTKDADPYWEQHQIFSREGLLAESQTYLGGSSENQWHSLSWKGGCQGLVL